MTTELPVIDFTTCKLIFPCGTTLEQIEELLKKHTEDYSVANFYPERQIGCNKIAFAVVDIPQSIMPGLYNEDIVKDIDLMASYSKAYSKAGGACCTPGGG